MTQHHDHILLVGMMGSGKTTIGHVLADHLGRTFLDSDEYVESTTGHSVAEIFATSGEAAFRAEEKKALAVACAQEQPAVIAVAGGAVLDESNRATLAASGRTVFLRAKVSTLVARLGDGVGRPLIEGHVAEFVPPLVAERYPVYEELADIVIDVDDGVVAEVIDQIIEGLRERVRVDLDERSYDVVIGPGASQLIDYAIPDGAKRAAIVTQDGLDFSIPCALPHTVVRIGQGEKHKSLAAVEDLCRAFSEFGLARTDVVVAVGGGLVTDVAGFAAAAYHRGTAVIHVSTTLLGQVDAAIGGKTGVNLPEGKNLVGAFFQPQAVFCDTDLLSSLPEREWRSGFGEMAKYAFLGVEDLDRLPLVDQVARCVALKADVVSSDERESGRRATLNYGHTLAHALEAAGFAGDDEESGRGGVDLRHGEAVGIGLVFAARLAERLGRIDEKRVERHLEVVSGYGLSTAIPKAVDLDEMITFMGRDKKASGDLTFVLDGPNGVELVTDVDRTTVREALEACVENSPTSTSQSAS